MQSRQPPSRLPPQESDIRRFENPLSEQPLHFNPLVLQSGLTPPPLSVEQPWGRPPAQQRRAAPLDLIGLNVCEGIENTSAELDVGWAPLDPAPFFKCPTGKTPSMGKFRLG